MAGIEINEDEVNWAIGKLLGEAAAHLGIEKSGDAALGYIADPVTWTTERTPALARRASDASVGRVYEVVSGTARRLQGIADVMRAHLVEMGYVLEPENADLLRRVNAKLAEIDTTPKTGPSSEDGADSDSPGKSEGGAGGQRVGRPGQLFPDRGAW